MVDWFRPRRDTLSEPGYDIEIDCNSLTLLRSKGWEIKQKKKKNYSQEN